MIDKAYAIGLKETLHYLKGVREEDVNKIPRSFMTFMEQNADANYVCNFDYTKSLNEIEIKDETRGIISMICLMFWCENQAEKTEYLKVLDKNEKKYKDNIQKSLNYEFPLSRAESTKEAKENLPVEVKEKHSIFGKIVSFFKNIFKRK